MNNVGPTAAKPTFTAQQLQYLERLHGKETPVQPGQMLDTIMYQAGAQSVLATVRGLVARPTRQEL
jgi:hypothetical protein